MYQIYLYPINPMDRVCLTIPDLDLSIISHLDPPESYMNIATWLIMLGEKSYGKIDIHCDNEYAFYYTCNNGHIDIAKYLVDLGENGYGRIDVHKWNDHLFRYACQKNHIGIVQLLIDLGDHQSYGPISNQTLCDGFHNALESANIPIINLIYQLSLQKSYGKIRLNLDHRAFGKLSYLYKGNHTDILQMLVDILKENGTKN